MNNNLINHINVVDALSDQISALLDLMQGCDNSTDMRTIHTASEMAVTMFDELMDEVNKWHEEDKKEANSDEKSIRAEGAREYRNSLTKADALRIWLEEYEKEQKEGGEHDE